MEITISVEKLKFDKSGGTERKTGGLVVWRSGSTIVLYRGANYEYPYFSTENNTTNDTSREKLFSESSMSFGVVSKKDDEVRNNGLKSGFPSPSNIAAHSSLVRGVGSPNIVRFQLPGEAQLAEEADGLLDGLGPRFTDWWGYDPLPIDADLLPAIVPGYHRPLRLLPYGVKPKLTDDEMTTLRRLGRPLPCHFALGRNRNLQGLAASIVKLWEKCEIVKVAIKRGVQNTNSDMMAEELKRLTGGTLLSRDREFIAFYRGKDFLPLAVSTAIEERRKHGVHKLKQFTGPNLSPNLVPLDELRSKETASVNGLRGEIDLKKMKLVTEKRKLGSTNSSIKSISNKLALALEKKANAEKLLEELEKAADPGKPELDKEGITEEERYMLKKVGLRMKPYVPMAARTLEAESGGVLVAVERVNRDYAIIIYRGKNYQRPAALRPRTLLNKKEAMKRSIEAQRRESLKLHVLRLIKNIDQLKLQLVKDDNKMEVEQSSEYKRPSADFEVCDHFGLSENTHDQDNVGLTESFYNQKVMEENTNDSTPMHSNFNLNATSDNKEFNRSNRMTNTAFQKNESLETELECLSEPNLKETQLFTLVDHDHSKFDYKSSKSKDGMTHSATNEISGKNLLDSSIVVDGNKLESTVLKDEVNKGSDVKAPLRVLSLSNRDRLVLRKQALKMKNRPVLAIGRSNIITGVAKALKTHFQKNTLAIVNIKGRAKGTSTQEVIFKLEQATGAVLVSQEPSKVILYRGWGEGEVPLVGINDKIKSKTFRGSEGTALKAVSPQLMEAIRLECGLESILDE
ncbi:hypothetical protein GIB67_032934 [Kingdonia uniflora]|uniref:CRM domain-containing protein n=1 Tax=Kingdonia uniflora TaxID=39325 RepID=A0A7J7MYI8_9MAGN|nr:hypothetical protein GIB67_032934 [Kingdonia uniflora]